MALPKRHQGGQQQGYLAARAKSLVDIKIGYDESNLRVQVKKSGGHWGNDGKL